MLRLKAKFISIYCILSKDELGCIFQLNQLIFYNTMVHLKVLCQKKVSTTYAEAFYRSKKHKKSGATKNSPSLTTIKIDEIR